MNSIPRNLCAVLMLFWLLTSSAQEQAATPVPPETTAVAAPAPDAPTAPAALDEQVQDLKSDVIKLNRDLLVLEEELLFPANTQVVLFVSMDVGKMFDLDSVQVKIDDKLVANYLYTPLEVTALHRGACSACTWVIYAPVNTNWWHFLPEVARTSVIISAAQL